MAYIELSPRKEQKIISAIIEHIEEQEQGDNYINLINYVKDGLTSCYYSDGNLLIYYY